MQAAVLSAVALLVVAMSSPAHANWADEFNGSGAPGWTFETGGGGWGNAELEYYQGGSANANQTGGYLNIQARVQSVGGMPYTSARIKTGSFGPYGHMEGRMQVPLGQCMWPAFWMLGTNLNSGVAWPACGEIDIMETVNSSNTEYGTIHWDNGGHQSYGVNRAASMNAWNTFAIDWNSSSITWLLNGGSIGSANILNNINGTEEFHRSFFLILNLAIGGSWPGNPNGTTAFPANFNIDYVRWTDGGSPAPTPTSAPAGGGAGTIVNKNSNKCVDAAAAGTANGTVIQQYTCNSSNAQKWTRTVVASPYVKIATANNANQVFDVSGGTTATGDGAKIALWTYGNTTNQHWNPVSEGTGYSHLVARHSGKCIDIPNASTADAVQLQQWTCNGSAAQSFKLN